MKERERIEIDPAWSSLECCLWASKRAKACEAEIGGKEHGPFCGPPAAKLKKYFGSHCSFF